MGTKIRWVIYKSDILYIVTLFLVYADSFCASLYPVFVETKNQFLLSYIGLAMLFVLNRNYDNRTHGVRKKEIDIVIYVAIIIILIFLGSWIIPSYLWVDLRYISLFLALLLTMNHEKWCSYYLKMLVAFSIVFIFTTIWLYFDKDALFKYFANNIYPNGRFTRYIDTNTTPGICDHYSHNGIILGNAFVVLFAMILPHSNDRKKKQLIVLLVACLIAMVLCGKRALVVFPLFGCGVAYILYNKVFQNGSKFIKFIFCVLLALTLLYVISTISPTLSSYLERFSGMKEDDNILGRYVYWATAIEQFKANPILGIGWLNFRNFNLEGNDAHNIYVQILCDTGIVGAIAFFGFYLRLLFLSYKNLAIVIKNQYRIPVEVHVFSLFSFIYQVYYLTYGITGNPHSLNYSLMPYVAACSIAIYLSKHLKNFREICNNE